MLHVHKVTASCDNLMAANEARLIKGMQYGTVMLLKQLLCKSPDNGKLH